MSQEIRQIPAAIMDGGELGELIRSYDWDTTSLGQPDTWPQSLKTCLRIMLTSSQPIWIGWGKELIKFYNDPYKAIVGGKHPWALGKPASVVWKDIWQDIGPMLKKVMYDNESTFVESQLLIMERNGYPEETYYTFSYTPVPGDDGETAGMFCANSDDTEKIITGRQLKTLTELGNALINSTTHLEVIHDSINSLKENPKDFPFAIFRTLEDGKAKFSYSTDIDGFEELIPHEIDLTVKGKFADIINKSITERKIQLVENVQQRFGLLPKGAWPVHPDKLLVLPIIPTGTKQPYGIMVVGVNPYRLVDEKFLGFYSLVADQIAKSFSQVQALEEERRRNEALAEIDKAKTIFFSNVSHEFRTPITLMLGTIEEALNDPQTVATNRERMDIAHRNAMRLLRLVNNLLDFSRIESGRAKANFQLADIRRFTAELASGFRSAIENAGIRFAVDADAIIQPGYIDKSMWEKIVLNLLSNAFKYTLHGSITVSVGEKDGSIVLKVADTGVGIPKEELPRMFQRFHRVRNITGRTHEGTGIGLSLVKELVELHGGSITVESEIKVGSVFTVMIPIGKKHLPIDQIADAEQDYEARLSESFIEEADGLGLDSNSSNTILSTGDEKSPMVLVVDDNPDMRQYIQQLLSKHFKVITASNGLHALQLMNQYQPQLVLSDIMMPIMDGVELLKNIKNEARWRHVPVILLSARAGEEAKIEGFDTGADDYLVKPFSGKELFSRIKSQLNLSEQRQREQNKLKQLLKQAPVGMCLLRGDQFIVEVANDRILELWGKPESQVLNKPLIEALTEIKGQGFEELLANTYYKGQSYIGNETPVLLVRNGIPQTIYVNFVYEPLYEEDKSISGVVVVATEVTEQIEARQKIRESEQRYATTVIASDLGLWDFDVIKQKVIASGKMAEIFGLDNNDEYTTEHLLDFIHPDDRRTQEELFTAIVNGTIPPIFQTEYRIYQKNSGALRWIRGKGKAFINDEGALYRTVGTVFDITSEKEAMQRQKEMQDHLEQLVHERTKELQRSNEDLLQFAHVASHDLKEPVRKVKTFASRLEKDGDSVLSEKGRHYLHKINSACERMYYMIDGVLTYSKVNQADDKFTAINLTEIIDTIETDLEVFTHQKNARIEHNMLPLINGIPVLIYQLFYNLLNNSLKFSSQLEAPFISISSHVVPDSGFVEIRVSDNGIGFDPSFADRIFDPFTRIHTKDQYEGTGLGLALCRKIVERHHGTISAIGEEGKGCTFTIVLPVTQHLK